MRRWAYVVPLLLAACAGERTVSTPAPAQATPGASVELLDEFETDARWTLESAGNHAVLGVVPLPNTSGAGALRVRFQDDGRDAASIRCEVEDDYSAATALILDACNPGTEPVSLSLALRSAQGSVFSTPSVTLAPGWNRDLRFALDAEHLAPGTDAKRLQAERNRIDRLIVNLSRPRPEAKAVDANAGNAGEHGGAAGNLAPLAVAPSGEVVLDRLRVESPQPVRRNRAPEVLATRSTGTAVGLRRPFLVSLDLRWPANTPAPGKSWLGTAMEPLPRHTALRARVRDPLGNERQVAGALVAVGGEGDSPTWTYRLAILPDRTGPWRYDITVGEGSSTISLPPREFACTGDQPGPALVQVDAQDPHWLSDSDGRFVWALGQNVGWAGDYRPWLDALAAAGGNTLRTWTCPWNLPLAAGGRFAAIDLGSATGIERLLDQAAERGIRVQLCLMYHGWLNEDWPRNPINRANGGPVGDAREFWTHWQAQAWFRRYLDYAVARWAHHPGLLAFELCNEADLCPSFQPDDIVAWHRSMAGYLASIDPWHHPVVASIAIPERLPDLWKGSLLDLVQPHLYHADPGQAMARVAAVAVPGKPLIPGEYGRGAGPKEDQADPEGRVIHVAQWLSWMHGFAGNPWPWWWDTQIQPRNLTIRFAAIGRYVAGEDPRGRTWRTVDASRDGLAARARISADRAYLYAWSPAWAAKPAMAWSAPLVKPGETLTIAGLAPGSWQVEWWDPQAGKALGAKALTVAEDGTAQLPLSDAGTPDLAAKLVRSSLVPALGLH